MQPGVSYRLRELDTNEDRSSGWLQPRDAEVRVMVRGEFAVESNAIEHLSVRIDGVLHTIPATIFGRQEVKFPDPLTVPPTPAKPATPKRGR